MFKVKSILFLALALFVTTAFAQTKTADPAQGEKTTEPSKDLYSGWSAVVRLGLNQPYTDINQYQYGKIWRSTQAAKSENRLTFNVGVQKMFTNIVGVQANLRVGSLQGTSRRYDKTYAGYTENLYYSTILGFPKNDPVYFKTPITQFDVDLYIDWTNLGYSLVSSRKGATYKRKLAVYSSIGLGFVQFDSKIRSIKNDTLYPTYLKGISGKAIETVIPISMGAKYKINNKMNIGVEYTLNNVFSDKLDGFVYNGTGLSLRQGVYDKYASPTVTFTYNFVGKSPNAENIEWANPYDDRVFNIKPIDTKALFADEDGDGVIDMMDKEPSTPNGCRVDGSGRAMDTDGDGVIDCKDRERLSPSGYPVDQYGVAQIPDTDGDGVADNIDWEVNSPPGCKVDAHGICPQNKGKQDSGMGTFLPTVYFDTDKSNIKRQYNTDLDLAVLTLKTHPDMKVNVIGNTDKHHTDEYNEKLGMRRAQSVAAYLMSHGISKDRLILKSNGKRVPASDKDELNRRTEITPAQ